MANIEREDIHIISRHSNWSSGGVAKMLKDYVYNDSKSWRKFLQLFFISLGVGFATSGIIFFFAYNWDDLHKFIKIGMVEGAIIIVVLTILLSKINLNLKNIMLTGTAMLVGVLFAVFGQIYQTGANAYDFFLGWTIFVTLWALVSKFPPLWLVYLTLINTTFILYTQQVAFDWSGILIFTLLFIINATILALFIWIFERVESVKVPGWFTNIIALAVVTFSTFGIAFGMFEPYENAFLILILAVALAYGTGIKYGLKAKNVFYLSIIPFSVIIIISAFLIKLSEEAGMFFMVGLFVIVSVTFLIKTLIETQKKWTNE